MTMIAIIMVAMVKAMEIVKAMAIIKVQVSTEKTEPTVIHNKKITNNVSKTILTEITMTSEGT